MYFVAEGEFECYHEPNEWGDDKKHLRNYVPGDIFGELCILHNSARMATI
jgi:CRP-like cAMP-binding protein